jgi:hypothetical protein
MAGINKTNLPAIFTFHDDPANVPKFIRIREAALEFAETVLDNTPVCADQSVAIHKFINEFIPELPTKIELLVAYTPDAVWVTEQMKDSGGSTVKLAELIHESLSREPVLVRGKTAEEMKKVV